MAPERPRQRESGEKSKGQVKPLSPPLTSPSLSLPSSAKSKNVSRQSIKSQSAITKARSRHNNDRNHTHVRGCLNPCVIPEPEAPHACENSYDTASTTQVTKEERRETWHLIPSPELELEFHWGAASRRRQRQEQLLPDHTYIRSPRLRPRPGKQHHPFFSRVLSHLSHPLTPLVSVTTGMAHPLFPQSILAYHLLDSATLDALALYYHQVEPPVEESFEYPVRVPGWVNLATGTGVAGNSKMKTQVIVNLETKRRRFGRFIGLRGCESPTLDESMEEKMERVWEDGLRKARMGGWKGL